MRLGLVLNHRCNLRCSYCYTGEKFDRPMPIEVAHRAIDLALSRARGRWISVSFFGGEPMLEPDLVDACCRYARARGGERGIDVHFSVSTNGTLLDPPRLDLLRRYGFEVQVSTDGSRAAQDATRRRQDGGSSFERVRANLALLLGTGLPVHVVAVVDPANVDEMPAGFDELADLGVPRVVFAPNQLGAWTEEACGRFEVALGALGERWRARLRRGDPVRLDPLHGKVVAHLRGDRAACVGCGFGVEELAVSPTGRLYPCERLVREDDDVAVRIGDLERGLDLARRDALAGARSALDAECAACELRARCIHWCGCVNYQTTGHPGGVSPIQCWLERRFIGEADRVAGALHAEGAPAFLRRFYGMA